MKTALLFAAAAATFGSVLAFTGCGNDTSSGGNQLPDRNATTDGGGSSTSSSGSTSSGGTQDSGSAASCTSSTLKTSDNPACDTCAKNKCCDQVLACEKSFDCKALGDCIGKCADGDDACILTCSAAHDNGTQLLQDLASCAQFLCSNECQGPSLDGGFDAF